MVFCVLEKLSLWLSAKIGWKLCHASIKLAALEIYNVIIWCPFLFPFLKTVTVSGLGAGV
jgi:hypothetical protein